jgi:DNA-binding transcriptional LysR family regulator
MQISDFSHILNAYEPPSSCDLPGRGGSRQLECGIQKLHVSQPAISRQLKWFEARLGVVLFERLPRGIRLTEAGELLRGYSARIFEIESTAAAAMRDIAGVARGQLTIGASNTIGTYLLPVWLAKFREKFPKIAVSLFVGNTLQVAEGVADLKFAYGFIEGPLHDPELRIQRLMDDELVPVVAAGHPLARKRSLEAEKIGHYPLLMREAGSGTRELVIDMLRAQEITPEDVMTLSNTEALKQAALQGAGIAWLPTLCMARELGEGQLRILKLPALSLRRPLNIVRSASAYLSPAGESFLELLQRGVRSL